MNADEEYVRARWNEVRDVKYELRINCPGPVGGKRFFGLHNRWKEARAFTEQREREIAEVQEEIEYVSSFAWLPSRSGKREEHPVWQRILAVEQARLAELRRGMKEASE